MAIEDHMDMVAMIINMDDMEAMEDMATDMVMGKVTAMVEDMTTVKAMIMEAIKAMAIKATIMMVMEDIKAMEAIIKAGMAKEQF